MARDVANLIRAENPDNLYHAIVSSSFDADRMDYLARDRYMTGTHAGAIDVDWLLNNITIYKVDINASIEGEEPEYRETFAFTEKAQQAAEDFLLARHRLYTQVYLHKTTRGIEQLLKALFIRIAECAELERGYDMLGLGQGHPLIEFFNSNGGKLEDYKRLDDTVVWGAIETITRSGDAHAKMLAQRLRNREKPKLIDLTVHSAGDEEKIINFESNLEQAFEGSMNKTVFKDAPPLNLYGRIGDDRIKEHKKVRVMSGGKAREITDVKGTVVSRELTRTKTLARFYFLSPEEYEQARKMVGG